MKWNVHMVNIYITYGIQNKRFFLTISEWHSWFWFTVYKTLETIVRQYYFTSAGANVIPVGQGITAKFPKKPNARTKLTTTKVSKTFKIRRGSCNILFRLGGFKSTVVYSRAASIFKFYRFTTNQVFLSTTLSMKFLIRFS